MTILYRLPHHWIEYDATQILSELTNAKAAMLALTQIPYQRSWAETLQQVQLKREVAGTSRIEGAEFTERELDAAMRDTPEQLETRSQRQAAAAVATYRWIATVPNDRPIDQSLIQDIHRRLVAGCDDDHCAPGKFRTRDENVTFGVPRHRGVDGGASCTDAIDGLVTAVRTVFTEHDPLIQALALHYHCAALHPFLDGNGRTARALEALVLQRIGLRDTLFIAMSNYYYEQKSAYLTALSTTGTRHHNLTPFLQFALTGIATQCHRLFKEIRHHVAKALYRNTMTDLFGRMANPRKRVMSARHMQLLTMLLDTGTMTIDELRIQTRHLYILKNPVKALVRDLWYLVQLQAIHAEPTKDTPTQFSINLEWPAQITETDFFTHVMKMPKGKMYG